MTTDRHPRDIADKFANSFKSACLPNSAVRQEKLKANFFAVFSNIFSPISPDFVINVEFVSFLVGHMQVKIW